MTGPYRLPDTDVVIAAALAEDLGVTPGSLSVVDAGLLDRDVTGSLLPHGAGFSGLVVMREAGVVCGLPVAHRVWAMLAHASGSEPVECFPLVAEGTTVGAGTPVMEVDGPARCVTAGERTALDMMMVLSGIATRASAWQHAAGAALRVVDTRKTLPGLRELSKYAVRVGGAHNHRMGLFDMVLVKDNHIAAAGGISAAVRTARKSYPVLLVEVEADTPAQAAEAAASGADMVLLDNMDDATIAEAVRAVREATPPDRRCLTEASGGVTMDRLSALARAGVDRVSSSALTMGAPLDVGLDAREG